MTDRLIAKVQVRPLPRSAVIEISVKSRSPDLAARIANQFAREHIRLQRKALSKTAAATAAELDPQVAALRAKVVAADRAVDDYRRRHNIVSTLDIPEPSQFGHLASSLADARSSRTEAMIRSQAATARDGETASAASSPLLNDLRRQAADLGKRVAELSAYYGAGYPELVRAQAQLVDTNARIAEETARVARELRAEVAVGRAREGQRSSDLASLQSQTMAQRAAAVELGDLQRTAEATRALYVSMLTRLKQLTGQSSFIEVPVKLLATAIPPDRPSFPMRKQIVTVALFAGLILGLILAYGVELLSENRVRTGDQLRRLIGVPMLGMIPHQRDLATLPIQRQVAEKPRSVLAEVMRAAYLECRMRLPPSRSHVLLVTSPLPGEGKTTVALGIAAGAAMLGRWAVVVDLDLRRPGLFRIGGIKAAATDLEAWLTGDGNFNDIVVEDDAVTGLSIVGVTGAVRDPAACLAAARLEQLIVKLRDRFDLVVINAPPVLAVRDAKTLSALADGTLLVVRWNRTRIDAVRAAAEVFGRPFIGAVINAVDFKRHSDARYGDALQHYREYSSYFNDDARQAA